MQEQPLQKALFLIIRESECQEQKDIQLLNGISVNRNQRMIRHLVLNGGGTLFGKGKWFRPVRQTDRNAIMPPPAESSR